MACCMVRAAAAVLASLAFVVLPFTALDQLGLMFAPESVIGWGHALGDQGTVADRVDRHVE